MTGSNSAEGHGCCLLTIILQTEQLQASQLASVDRVQSELRVPVATIHVYTNALD